jgi:hypothetical protein
VQLARSAGHTCATRSSAQPGNAVHSVRTQRARGRCAVTPTASGAAAGASAGGGLAGAAGGPAGGGGAGGGKPAQPASTPRIAALAGSRQRCAADAANPKDPNMWLIVLEALAALALLVLIVWWTMFSGRRRGEPPSSDGGDREN